MQSNRPTDRAELSLVRLLGISISARLLIDTVSQLFNPFLTLFAAGMGIDVITLGRLLSLRLLTGVFTPILGALADRHGYRRIMRLALVTASAGLLLVAISRGMVLLIVGMIALGIGQAGFVPALQAYLSARLPYAIRARGLGILEYSWALAGIIGLFLVGQLIERADWRAPLFVLAGGLLCIWLLFGLLPAAPQRIPQANGISTATKSRQLAQFFDLGPNARSAYGAIFAGALLFFTGIQLTVIYGVWLTSDYGLGAAALGLVALLIGCFDLVASVSVSIFTDRMGKRRSVMLGVAGTAVSYALLPFLNNSLAVVIVGIALTRGFFEFGIVSHLSLLSEQVPEQRGKLMSLSSAVVMVGGALANLTGPWLYVQVGIGGLCATSVLALVMSLILLATLVREPQGATI